MLQTTIAFGLIYAAAALVLGQTPAPGDDGQTVASWFRDHGDQVRLWMWLLVFGLPLFATFAALVRAELPSPYGDVFFFGAVALAAVTGVQGWFWLGMSWHAGHLQPATARTLLDVASFWGPVLTSATVTMLAPVTILAIRGAGGLPRWVGVVAGVALIEQLIETITIFGRDGFTAPGGPMNVYLGAGLTAVALVTLGVGVSRKIARSQ
jgi:hypothetical protein